MPKSDWWKSKNYHDVSQEKELAELANEVVILWWPRVLLASECQFSDVASRQALM